MENETEAVEGVLKAARAIWENALSETTEDHEMIIELVEAYDVLAKKRGETLVRM